MVRRVGLWSVSRGAPVTLSLPFPSVPSSPVFFLCTVHVRLIFFSEKGTTLCSISHRKEESRNAWYSMPSHSVTLPHGRTDGMQVLKEGGGKSTLFSTLEMLRETVDNLVDGCVQAVQAARGRRRSWGGGVGEYALRGGALALLTFRRAPTRHVMTCCIRRHVMPCGFV